MTDSYFTDSGVYTSQALPTPSDTPYRTPSFSRSRRTSGRGTPLSAASTTPPPIPSSDDIQKDEHGEDISPLDPRRFTPTLHASLVSEILSLRRELESKHGFIEKLETSYAVLKNENEALNEKLVGKERESRAVKKQLQGLEDGTLSVIEELCKERDQTNIAHNELKKRHETALKKIKTQEDEAEQSLTHFERDKRKWDDDRRLLERKVYLSEGRLRSLVEELQSQELANGALDSQEVGDNALGNESETGSIRSLKTRIFGHGRQRSSSLNDLRDSYLNAAGLTGISLADELQSDDDDDEEPNIVGRGFHGENAAPQNTRHSRQSSRYVDDDEVMIGTSSNGTQQIVHHSRQSSRYLGDEARKAFTTSNDSPVRETRDYEMTKSTGSANGIRELPEDSNATVNKEDPAIMSRSKEVPHEQAQFKVAYVDTGIQFTPPPSPQIPPQSVPLPEDVEELRPVEDSVSQHVEDQSITKDYNTDSLDSAIGMSTSRQSWGDSILPLNFLETAKDHVDYSVLDSTDAKDFIPTTENRSVENASASPVKPSQAPPPPPPTRAPPPAPIIIPSITIHPPTSVPSSPGEAVLPPAYKNASSQTDSVPVPKMRSVSMQTESIRLDKRLAMLPPHLQPSTILAAPASPPERIGVRTGKDLSPVPEDSPESSARKAKRQVLARELSPTPPLSAGLTYDDVFSENDADDLTGEGLRYPRLGKPFRPYIRSSGSNVFDYDHFDELGELDLSDNEYESYVSNGKPVRRLSKHRMPPSVPEDQIVGFRSSLHRSRGSSGSRGSFDRSTVRSNKSYGYTVPNRPTDNRRAVLSQKSGYADMQLSRSPSIGSVASSSNISKSSGPAPPFAIPIRKSSASATTVNKSEASGSPTTRSGPSIREPRKVRSVFKDRQSIRKSFSTTSLRDEAESSRKSREFNLTSVPGTAGVPPLPKLDLSMYQTAGDIASSSTRYQQFTAVTPTGNASVGASIQYTVVDAIAACMIGEWMWKYIRKRTSFGISDSNQDFAKSSDARHKRWVWLSPYEKTVMWSSKQPSSNAALMGKNGRKFIVQSVLDVKDDSPWPKASATGDVFDRSILVLTPTRALKFTAMSREKHYVWLTALSFLAHNTSSIPDTAFFTSPNQGGAVPAPQIMHSDLPRSSPNNSARGSRAPSLRRSGAIRDAFRVPRERGTLVRPVSAQAPQNLQNFASGSTLSSPAGNHGTLPPAAAGISDAAAPPTIARIYGPRSGTSKNPILTMHNDRPVSSRGPRLRKRSSTNPKARATVHSQDPPPGTSGAKSYGAAPGSNPSSRFSTANPTASSSATDVRLGSTVASGVLTGTTVAMAPTLPSPISTAAGAPVLPVDFANAAAPTPTTAGSATDLSSPVDATAAAAAAPAAAAASLNGTPKASGNMPDDTPRSSGLSAAFGGNYNFFDAVARSAASSPGVGFGLGPGSIKGVKGVAAGGGGGALASPPPGMAMMQHGIVSSGASGSAMAVAGGR